MKYIEQKQAQLPPIGQTFQNESQASGANSATHSKSFLKAGSSIMSQEMSIYEMDKKKYGALLPKSGVYFMPDDRIVIFLKIMRTMIHKFESEHVYNQINRYKALLDKYKNGE